ncbi:MAG: hypothetical protein AAGK05_18165, partial [Pseudomonadota bacterium]
SNNSSLGYYFYFDNLFSNVSLLLELQRRGYGGTGTMRENRIPKNCNIRKKKEVAKEKRGTCAFTADVNNDICILHWRDNKVVSLISTCDPVHPIGTCQRFSRANKEKVTVDIPNTVKMYNKFMGGTDRMDQNVNCYRVSIRGKKWYYPIFSWSVDVSIQNAWQLHRKSGGNLCLLSFRRRIAMSYLTKYGRPAIHPGKRKSHEKGTLGAQSRFDGLHHYIQVPEGNKRRRCVGEFCKAVVRTECKKCDVGLCVQCFPMFHTS